MAEIPSPTYIHTYIYTLRCSTVLLALVVLIGFTCPAITVVTVILRALDRVRERVLGLLCLSITQIPARVGTAYCVVLAVCGGGHEPSPGTNKDSSSCFDRQRLAGSCRYHATFSPYPKVPNSLHALMHSSAQCRHTLPCPASSLGGTRPHPSGRSRHPFSPPFIAVGRRAAPPF